jgi:hypothetical protein
LTTSPKEEKEEEEEEEEHPTMERSGAPSRSVRE